MSSQRDFAESYRDALNDKRQVYMVGDTVMAFIAGTAWGAFIVFGLLA